MPVDHPVVSRAVQRHTVVAEGGTVVSMAGPLNDADLAAALDTLPAWSGDTNGLLRTVSLPTFPAAIAAVDSIAVVAEEMNHHPDIDIRWRTLTFRLSTHDAGGRVSAKDVALAKSIDAIVEDH